MSTKEGKTLIEVFDMAEKNDTAKLDWIERTGAQLWRDKRAHNWTCQVITHGQVIQPSRASLRAAITDAIAEHRKVTNNHDRPKPTDGGATKGA
jgi:hypothetical protein